MKGKEPGKKPYLTAKLSIHDWGWGDKVIYRLTGKTTEKMKGLQMLEQIKLRFGINNFDEKDYDRSKITDVKKEMKRIDWARDDRGNIVSPFSKNVAKKE